MFQIKQVVKTHKLEHAIVSELVPISRRFDPETDISQVPKNRVNYLVALVL